MTNQTQDNPYLLTAGYEPNHDIAMTGYGLTISSILYWLFDKNLPTAELGYQTQHPEDYEDAMAEDYDAFLQPMMPDNVLSYVQTANADVDALMMFDVSPSEKAQTVPSTTEINKQLVTAIMAIYAVPDKYKADLTEFVGQYADYISITDYC